MVPTLVRKYTVPNGWQLKVGYFSVVVSIVFCVLFSIGLSVVFAVLFADSSQVSRQTIEETHHSTKPAQSSDKASTEAATSTSTPSSPPLPPTVTSRSRQSIGLISEFLPLTDLIPANTPVINPTSRKSGDSLNDGPCSISTVTRSSSLGSESETVISCSQVNKYNYRHLVKSIYKRTKLNIQQVEITNSEPTVVFSVIDLICDKFNCSGLTVFNVTQQEIHDYNVLSSWISSWPQLEILDLSNTSLTDIQSILQMHTQPSIVLQNLTTLIANNNSVGQLDFDFILNHLPNLRHLSLVNNSILNIHCSQNLRPKVLNQFESISLAGNFINCDKSQLWLMKPLLIATINHRFPDYDLINCSVPVKLAEMTWVQRVSVLETPICNDCECRSLKRTALSVDCHNKNLTALPGVLPLNTKVLNLTSNRIESLGVPHNSKNWENVTYVYLENNLITSFQPLEINPKFMRNLAALDIRRNKFQEFPSHIFEQFINLDQVHLSNNPWLCDCESAFAFQEWLQRQFHKVGDKEEIMCGISGYDENGVRSFSLQQRLSSRVIYQLSKSELCPQDNLEEPYDWLDVVNIVLGLTILLVVSKVVLDYVYQHRTKRLPHFFRLNF